MMSSLLPNIPEAKRMKHTNFKTLNPNAHGRNAQQTDQTPARVPSESSRDGGVIFDLDSCSAAELKELKKKFVSDVERIRGFVKQIESRELKLRQVNSVEKSSEIIRQKRTMHVTPDREIKRGSNNTKTIKTIEMNSNESRKVEAAMTRRCGVILDKLMKHRHGWVFNKPVDVVALRLPDYYQVVKRPMDLGTIKLKLDRRVYGSPLDFAKDVRLTFDNAMLYNRKGEEVHTMATVLLDMFDNLFDPAYEKYEVERRRVIVEQGKFDRQEALDTNFSKEAAGKSVSKRQRTVPEVEENPPMRSEMSDSERDQLGYALQDLAGEYLDEILQIVAKRNSKMTTPDGDGEIELDVRALDSETLWDLDRFVRLKSEAGQNNKSPVAIEEDIGIGDEIPIIDYPIVVIKRDDTSSRVSKVRASSGTDSSSGKECNFSRYFELDLISKN